METTEKFSINLIGEKTGSPFIGDFTVKTVLSRRDEFAADSVRRDIMGPNPQDILPALKVEAFILGQLAVRITSAPKWWMDSNNGLDLSDLNVVTAIYEAAKQKENERQEKLKSAASDALKQLANESK